MRTILFTTAALLLGLTFTGFASAHEFYHPAPVRTYHAVRTVHVEHNWGHRVWSPVYHRYHYWDRDQHRFFYYDTARSSYYPCP
jgi:hypothetical protein